MTAEDLTGTLWLDDPDALTTITRVVGPGGQPDLWRCFVDGEASLLTTADLYTMTRFVPKPDGWSRVPDAAPAEDEDEQLPDWCEGDPSHLPPAVSDPILPSDVRDGDLLTGTFGMMEFTAMPAETNGLVFLGPTSLSEYDDAGGHWKPYVTVTARKPAPSPLPWIEHPDAWWRRTVDAVTVTHSSIMAPPDMVRDSAAREFERVAVIPWDLIEDLWLGYGMGSDDIDAVIDAADGAS